MNIATKEHVAALQHILDNLELYSYDFYQEDKETYCLDISNTVKMVIFRIKDNGSLHVQLGYGGDTLCVIDERISEFVENLRSKHKKEREELFNNHCSTFLNSFVIIDKYVVK